MLELQGVRKSYTTGDFTQVALDDVSITFRDNEFVAVLGPSGSGKTTMLNVVGGLDHYDSGNLIIDGVATSEYKDRDWDTYRNNRIGFVFQSYNLIPHQTVLANVELALTLAGVSPSERRARAIEALGEVGLGDHVHKRPNQLSGGQMQRVAIARALINDPEILLADEPTGALDTTTSVAIMALLTSIAKDRLVIMVTHNPELAEQYATRIVSLRDGVIESDTSPVTADTAPERERPATRHTRMSFFTAVALSFNNLMTKKGRTLMTSFAGSIGIIGIAAILALANGVNAYILGIEEDTLSMYPLTIQRQGFDLGSILAASAGLHEEMGGAADGKGQVQEVDLLSSMFGGIGTNDLGSLKRFLEDNGGGIDAYTNAIEYTYDVTPQIFSSDTTDGVRQVNPDDTFTRLGLQGASDTNLMGAMGSTSVFSQLVDNLSLVETQYDVAAGRWPSAADETVVVLSTTGGISDLALYAMGLRDPAELDAMVEQIINEQPVITPSDRLSLSYEDVMGVTFRLVPAVDRFTYDADYGVWTDRSGDSAHMREQVAAGETLRVVGVVKPSGDSSVLQPGIYYTSALTRHLMAEAAGSDIVKSQLEHRDTNVFSGEKFAESQPGASEIDLSSLVSVDEEAIKKAVKFDESKLKLDLSGLDDISLPELAIDPADLPQLDLGSVLGELDLTTLIKVPADLNADLGQATGLVTGLAQAYAVWAAANALDPAAVETTFPAFLASDEATALLAGTEAPGIVTQLVAGYLAYAAGQGIDPADMAGSMEGFLASEQGQALQEQAMGLIDTASLEAQLQGVLADYMEEAMASVSEQLGAQLGDAMRTQITSALEGAMGQLSEQMASAMSIDEGAFAEAFTLNKDQEELTQLLMSMASTQQASDESNLRKLGYASVDEPSGISIYPIDFESKGQIISILDAYNEEATAAGEEDRVITYTDLVGALMGSVTDIINMVSYVLVAFVAISLIVSSIMIGVITYISVLERKKEIGILRSIGASKGDIRTVFNAETLIVGFVAGALGVGITFLLTIPANAIVYANFDVERVARLPWQAAIVLVAISMGLTSLAGLIPASAASRKDPVEALRSE